MKILLLGAPTTDGYRAIGHDENICGGGWVENLISVLKQSNDLELTVLFYSNNIDKVTYAVLDNVTYVALPERVKSLASCNQAMIDDLSGVLKKVNPDVVHNIGTEREHNYQLFKLAGREKTVISLTGLVSVIYKHYFGGMLPKEYKKRSIGDYLRRTSLSKQQKQFFKWGHSEQALLSEAKFVMGRTTWDYAYLRQLNPSAKYIHCGELLNECFSKDKWAAKDAMRHTIFISQASYPLKGLHMLLQAMPFILSKYPNTKIVVGGINIIRGKSFIDRIKRTSYAVYLHKLIKKYNLESHVDFKGALTATQMKEQYLKCNVFVMPSAIENSPNSLGEAMSLGVPIVASYVGGIPDMVEHKKSALLYDFSEAHMLAHYICSIFSDDNLAAELGKNAMVRARELFNSEQVLKATVDSYYEIVKDNRKND